MRKRSVKKIKKGSEISEDDKDKNRKFVDEKSEKKD